MERGNRTTKKRGPLSKKQQKSRDKHVARKQASWQRRKFARLAKNTNFKPKTEEATDGKA